MMRSLKISMSAASVDALKNQNAALYAFQAVRYGPKLRQSLMSAGFGGGYPLVWFRSTTYMANTAIPWDDNDLSAYISSTPLADNARIDVGDSQAIGLGEMVMVTANGTLGLPTQGPNPSVATITSDATDYLACGLAAKVSGGASPAPICAFPLNPGGMDMITPTQQVLAMFALDQPQAGMAITTAYAPGMLVDFNTEAQRSVSFDIKTGWSAGGATWSRKVSVGSNLVSLLILPANPS